MSQENEDAQCLQGWSGQSRASAGTQHQSVSRCAWKTQPTVMAELAVRLPQLSHLPGSIAICKHSCLGRPRACADAGALSQGVSVWGSRSGNRCMCAMRPFAFALERRAG